MVVPFMTLYLTGKSMNRTLGEAGAVIGIFCLGSIIGAYFGGVGIYAGRNAQQPYPPRPAKGI